MTGGLKGQRTFFFPHLRARGAEVTSSGQPICHSFLWEPKAWRSSFAAHLGRRWRQQLESPDPGALPGSWCPLPCTC